MLKLIQPAARNLLRYQRRTLLTSLLIVIGVAAVLLFMAISGSFKQLMIGQITDSMLGHLQVHRRGYVASIESLPLNLNMASQMVTRVNKALADEPAVAAISPRIKFGAMFSNFTETTSLRVNGIEPDAEAAVLPLLAGRQRHGVTVARALGSNAKMVLADEPTANLDHDTAHKIIDLMKQMRDEFGTTFIFSTHDPKIMAEAETTYTLEDGRVLSSTNHQEAAHV